MNSGERKKVTKIQKCVRGYQKINDSFPKCWGGGVLRIKAELGKARQASGSKQTISPRLDVMLAS